MKITSLQSKGTQTICGIYHILRRNGHNFVVQHLNTDMKLPNTVLDLMVNVILVSEKHGSANYIDSIGEYSYVTHK